MFVARTTSAAQTKALAGALARGAAAGDVILLAGQLGAGKTAFAQGFGEGLGVTDPVLSPTFTIARQYEGGRLPLHHLDVYRLDYLNEVLDAGLNDLLDEGGVVLIEWGDAIVPVLPANYLEVRITFGDDDDERRLVLRPVGARWSARARTISTTLADWLVDERAGDAKRVGGAGGGSC